MNKLIKINLAAVAMMGLFLTSCSTPSENLERAEQKVTDANENLKQENEDYKKDMEDYKKITAAEIAANEKSIAAFNVRISTLKSEAKKEYEAKISKLNNKNSDLKKKMDDFKTDSKSNWEMFKAEFSHDMGELGTAIKDFTIKNEKD